MLDDGKAEAGSAEFSRPSLIDAVEAFKNAWQVAFRDANSSVVNFDRTDVAFVPPAQSDAAVGRRVLDGIVDEIVKDAAERFDVGKHMDAVGFGRVDAQMLRTGVRPRLVSFDAFVRHFGDGDWLKGKQLFAGFNAGQAEQIENQRM